MDVKSFLSKHTGRRGSQTDLKVKTLTRRSSVGYPMSPFTDWKLRDFDDLYECLKVLGRGAQGSVLSLRSKKFAQNSDRPVVAKFYRETPETLLSVTNEIMVLKELNKDGCQPFLLCYQENFRCFGSSIPPGACGVNVYPQETMLVVVYDYFLGKGTTSLQNLIHWTILPDTNIRAPAPSAQYDTDYEMDNLNSSAYNAEYLDDLLLDYLDEEEEEEDEDEESQEMDEENRVFTLTAPIVLEILYTLVRAVSYLHEHGVAHLDLKPDNVIVNLEKGRVQLIDFGLSCMEMECSPAGTPDYLAPEIAKKIGSRNKKISIKEAMLADSWSIGVMLFQLVNKENPFKISGDTIYFLGAKLNQGMIKTSRYEGPSVHESVSEKVNTIIDGFLRVSLKERLTVNECEFALQ